MKQIRSYFFSVVTAFLAAAFLTVAFGIESAPAFAAIMGAAFVISMIPARNQNVLNACFLQANVQRPGNCGGNPSGLQVIGYFAFRRDIVSMPELSTTINNATDASTLIGAFVMAAGKTFIPIYNVQDRSSIVDELVGPVGGKQWKSTASGFIADIDAARIQFGINAANEEVIYIGVDKKGKARVVGSLGLPAMMDTAQITTGMTPEDLRGMEFTFIQHSPSPAPYLADGITIPLADQTTADLGS